MSKEKTDTESHAQNLTMSDMLQIIDHRTKVYNILQRGVKRQHDKSKHFFSSFFATWNSMTENMRNDSLSFDDLLFLIGYDVRLEDPGFVKSSGYPPTKLRKLYLDNAEALEDAKLFFHLVKVLLKTLDIPRRESAYTQFVEDTVHTVQNIVQSNSHTIGLLNKRLELLISMSMENQMAKVNGCTGPSNV